MDDHVTDSPAAHRFEMPVGDTIAAYCRLEDGKVVHAHRGARAVLGSETWLQAS